MYSPIKAVASSLSACAVKPASAPSDDTPVLTRIVTQPVTPGDLSPQLDALESRSLTLRAQTVTRSSDTIDSLLARLGVNDLQAATFLRRDVQARRILQGRAGKAVRVSYETGAGGLTRLKSLVALGPAMSAEQLEHFQNERVRLWTVEFRQGLTTSSTGFGEAVPQEIHEQIVH